MIAKKHENSNGFALVLVLVAVALLALLLETALFISKSTMEGASAAELHARLECAADSVVNEGILTLVDQRQAMRWPVDGGAREVKFGGFPVVVTIHSEAGKVDLNNAPRELILNLFTAAGVNGTDANLLADRVMDWREPGELKRLNGAKSAEYRAAGLLYRPRLGPFQTIGELKLVMGMTPEIYDRIKDSITVYKLFPVPELQTASPVVLSAIGLNAATIKSIMAARANGQVAPYGDLIAPNGVERIPGLPMTAFTITATASGDGQVVTRSETVRFTGHPEDPFWVLAWK